MTTKKTTNTVVYVKKDGKTEIEINKTPENIEMAKSLGWKPKK